MARLKTIETHPHHNVIGHDFQSYGNNYHCESHDPTCGFWMVNTADKEDRRNVSENAPHRTFRHSVNKCPHPDCKTE